MHAERARLAEPLLPRPRGAHETHGGLATGTSLTKLVRAHRRGAYARLTRPNLTEATYDVVLIDGRYRTACAWAVLPYLTETAGFPCRRRVDPADIVERVNPDGALFQFDKTARDPKTHLCRGVGCTAKLLRGYSIGWSMLTLWRCFE